MIKINQKYSKNILFEEIFEVMKINGENLEAIVKRRKKPSSKKKKKADRNYFNLYTRRDRG